MKTDDICLDSGFVCLSMTMHLHMGLFAVRCSRGMGHRINMRVISE